MKPSLVLQRITQYTIAGVPAAVDLHLDKGDSSGPRYPDKIFDCCSNKDLIGRYSNPKPLEDSIACYYNVPKDRVIATAGADDALERVCKAVLGPGDELLQAAPTFEMIERYALLAGANVKKVPWPKDQYPLEQIVSSKSDKTKLLTIVSPNNPTGQTIDKATLLKLSAEFSDTLIILDLAYVEFAEEDLTEEAIKLPNVVITRSFSKAWGLAGARIGYAIGPSSVISWMRRAGVPFSVAGTSLELARQTFEKGRREMQEFVSLIVNQRKQCAQMLKELKVEVLDSKANFVCAKFSDAKFVWQALSGLGIAVRYFPHIPELSDTLRITLPGDELGFLRLMEGLQTVLNPEAILFDIDGVIADSSQSYRRTVSETAKAFGVTVTPEMITKAKSEGSANDDWELTYRFISAQKEGVSLSDVTCLFEELYQGTEHKTGLCREEKLLGSLELLSKLSKTKKLGVVTGRPRQDVERFLEYVGVAQYFNKVISREDAPLKPNPDGICKAMKELGCKTAWMLGDTPDDMRAARSATFQFNGITVLPIGVLAPWDDGKVMNQTLYDSGTGVVFGGIEEFYRAIDL